VWLQRCQHAPPADRGVELPLRPDRALIRGTLNRLQQSPQLRRLCSAEAAALGDWAIVGASAEAVDFERLGDFRKASTARAPLALMHAFNAPVCMTVMHALAGLQFLVRVVRQGGPFASSACSRKD